MKKNVVSICLVIFLFFSFIGCNSNSTVWTFKNEFEPRENLFEEKTFRVEEDGDVRLKFSFEFGAERFEISVIDAEDDTILMNEKWVGLRGKMGFEETLTDLQVDKEYILRIEGDEVSIANVKVTSKKRLITEYASSVEKPEKPMK